MVKDNKKIKRQSAMLLSQMSASPLKAVNIDIDVEEPSNDQDELVQKLNGTISGEYKAGALWTNSDWAAVQDR